MDNDDAGEEKDGGKGIKLVMTDKELECGANQHSDATITVSSCCQMRSKGMVKFAINYSVRNAFLTPRYGNFENVL